VTAAQEKQRPLIRYAGSAAETSIGSKPIGSELNAEVYPKRHFCQAGLAMAGLAMAQSWAYLPDLGQRHGRYARAAQIKSETCIYHFWLDRVDSRTTEPAAMTNNSTQSTGRRPA